METVVIIGGLHIFEELVDIHCIVFMKNMNHVIYLALGGNMGDRQQILKEAIRKICLFANDKGVCSKFYETVPVGFCSDNLFLNCVIKLKTDHTPFEWLEYTQLLERELGRTSKSINLNYKDRPVDIDILLYDDMQLDIVSPIALSIPHPRMLKRAFVMIPLCDIDDKLSIPGSDLTSGQAMALLPKEDLTSIRTL